MFLRLAAASATLVLTTLFAVPNANAGSDCRFTQGYWQNRAQNANDMTSAVWLALRDQSFYVSGLTYGQVLLVSPRGNAYWILAHQLVAAEANFYNNANASGEVAIALAGAQELLSLLTPAQVSALPKSDPVRAELIGLADTLDDWNNGVIGSGLCDGNSG
jgi:hypothetical protein